MLKHLSVSFEQRRTVVAAVAASLALAIAGSLAGGAAFGQGTGEGSGAQQFAIYCQTVGGELACGDSGDPPWVNYY